MNQQLIHDLDDIMPAVVDTGLLSLTVTFQERLSVGSSGAPSGSWTDVTDLADIACMAAPRSDGGQENRMPGEVQSRNLKHVLLDGYYPAVEERYRAVIDGVAHNVVSVEHDSQHQMTRVYCEKVEI